MKEKLCNVEVFLHGPVCVPFEGVTEDQAVDLELLIGGHEQRQLVINGSRHTFKCEDIMYVGVHPIPEKVEGNTFAGPECGIDPIGIAAGEGAEPTAYGKSCLPEQPIKEESENVSEESKETSSKEGEDNEY